MPTFVGFVLNQGAEIGGEQEQGMGQTNSLRHFPSELTDPLCRLYSVGGKAEDTAV
jgi:hypothetical protein